MTKKIEPPRASGLVRLRTMSRRNFALSAAAAAAGLSVMGPFRPAAAATSITYMGWQGYDDAVNVDGFLDKNGLVLATTYMESLEQLLAAIQNGGKGSMDLGILANSYVQYAAEGGLLQPLDMSQIPNIQQLFPDFRNMESLHYQGKAYAVPFAWGSLPLMYNADVIKTPPDSWWELFNPAYKGKAAIVKDIGGVFQIFSIMANKTKTPWNNTKEMLDKTVDLLIKFKKEQARTICESYGDLGGLLGNGEVIIAQGWEPVSQMTGKNSPTIKWVYPKEGYPNFVDSYVIVADAPHMDWDHKILNHVLSAKAQAVTSAKNTTAVVNQEAVALLTDAQRSLYPYNDINSFFEKAGGFGQMFPFKPGSQYESYDNILKGWERFLKA